MGASVLASHNLNASGLSISMIRRYQMMTVTHSTHCRMLRQFFVRSQQLNWRKPANATLNRFHTPNTSIKMAAIN